jgi:predicted RNA binding protein YcfA (HicA-like mRNA interferase family)
VTRLPRGVSGGELIRKLREFGYEPTRQTGSHVRLSRDAPGGQHHLTVPLHRNLRVGTLNSIVKAVAEASEMSKDEVVTRIFG